MMEWVITFSSINFLTFKGRGIKLTFFLNYFLAMDVSTDFDGSKRSTKKAVCVTCNRVK